jgi:hypothetical protein
MIVERKDGFYVISHKGTSLGGPYKTRKRAQARLDEVEMFKHMTERKTILK